MQPRLINPAKASPFVPEIEAYPGNQSGIIPIGTKVLLVMDEIKAQTLGGIFIPDQEVERQSLANTTGWLVAVGGAAFSNWPHSKEGWPGDVPGPGDRVYVAKYAGLIVHGDDGRSYRLCQDLDVCGFKTGEKQ